MLKILLTRDYQLAYFKNQEISGNWACDLSNTTNLKYKMNARWCSFFVSWSLVFVFLMGVSGGLGAVSHSVY
jgi:hypothetical protein